MTAIEWLIKEYFGDIENCSPNFRNKIQQAKEMEKQQIIEAHFQGIKGAVLNLSEYIDIPKTLKTIEEIQNGIGKHDDGEDYYNEKFNGQDT